MPTSKAVKMVQKNNIIDYYESELSENSLNMITFFTKLCYIFMKAVPHYMKGRIHH